METYKNKNAAVPSIMRPPASALLHADASERRSVLSEKRRAPQPPRCQPLRALGATGGAARRGGAPAGVPGMDAASVPEEKRQKESEKHAGWSVPKITRDRQPQPLSSENPNGIDAKQNKNDKKVRETH